MISANICTSIKINKLSWPAKTIFTWMIVRLCDDDGRMDGGAETVKAAVVPLADIDIAGVESCLHEMETVEGQCPNDKGVIIRYQIDSRIYIQVKKWDEFQSFHGIKKFPSRIPAPPDNTNPGGHHTKPGANKVNKDNKTNKGKSKSANAKTENRLTELAKGLPNIGKKMRGE